MEAFQKDIGAIAAAARAYNTNGRHRNPGERPPQLPAGFSGTQLRHDDEAAAGANADARALSELWPHQSLQRLLTFSVLRLAAVMEAATLLEDAAEDELAMRQHDLDAAEELELELA